MLAINPQPSSDTAGDLCRTWRAWSKSLSRYVRSDGRAGPSDFDYQQCHVDVLRAIVRRREEIGDDPLLRRIEALAAPWINLAACRAAADCIKRDLLQQCVECEVAMGSRKRRGSSVAWRIPAIAAALVLVAIVLGADLWASESHSLLGQVRYGLFKVGFWIRYSSVMERVIAGVFAMLAVGWWTTQKLRSI